MKKIPFDKKSAALWCSGLLMGAGITVVGFWLIYRTPPQIDNIPIPAQQLEPQKLVLPIEKQILSLFACEAKADKHVLERCVIPNQKELLADENQTAIDSFNRYLHETDLKEQTTWYKDVLQYVNIRENVSVSHPDEKIQSLYAYIRSGKQMEIREISNIIKDINYLSLEYLKQQPKKTVKNTPNMPIQQTQVSEQPPSPPQQEKQQIEYYEIVATPESTEEKNTVILQRVKPE